MLAAMSAVFLQGFSPALSYNPELQFEEFLMAQDLGNRRLEAISDLLIQKQKEIFALDEQIKIREFGLTNADNLRLRKKKLEQEKENLLNLKTKTEQMQKQTAILIESSKNALRKAKTSEEIYLRTLISARTEALESEQSFLEYSSRKDDINDVLKKTFSEINELTLLWPVKPELGISAYFHDENYKNRFGITHNAIDIPVAQGSGVRAAADGIVVKIKENGLGYSYITLAHSGDILTTYGHVSKISVKEGDVVARGEVIGRSGGTPGTLGAGNVTTGAHLHFEVRRGGEFKDPLELLDRKAL